MAAKKLLKKAAAQHAVEAALLDEASAKEQAEASAVAAAEKRAEAEKALEAKVREGDARSE